MSEIRCFLLEPLPRARRSLRRYASGSKCPGPYGYHDASTNVGDEDLALMASESGSDTLPHDGRAMMPVWGWGAIVLVAVVWLFLLALATGGGPPNPSGGAA